MIRNNDDIEIQASIETDLYSINKTINISNGNEKVSFYYDISISSYFLGSIRTGIVTILPNFYGENTTFHAVMEVISVRSLICAKVLITALSHLSWYQLHKVLEQPMEKLKYQT